MQETLTGVPGKIYRDGEFKNEYGTFHKWKFLMSDGTKCVVNSKDGHELKFKENEPCEYHILERMKDDIVKVKHGAPYTGGSQASQSSQPQTNTDDLITKSVCVKAAAAAIAGTSKDWEPLAERMYKWILGELTSKLEWNEAPPNEEDDDLPF